jgi:hypothetical protein
MRMARNRLCGKCALLLGVSLACSSPARSDDPPALESLPHPQKSTPEAIVIEEAPFNSLYLRTSRYDVWQYYGVDRTGHWRLRVVLSPYGAYYLFNGQPFPWVSSHPTEVTPIIGNAAVIMPYADD